MEQILAHVFDTQVGTHFQNGLVHAKNREAFQAQLNSVKEK